MDEPFDSIAKILFGGLLTLLFTIWRERRRDRETREREILDAKLDRLRHFRDDISEIIARLDKVADGDAKTFNSDTRDQVLVLCARVSEDIPDASSSQFACACADYCEMQERDGKAAGKFILYLFRNPPLNPREPIPNPFRDDQRPRKERMLDALQKLRDYAK